MGAAAANISISLDGYIDDASASVAVSEWYANGRPVVLVIANLCWPRSGTEGKRMRTLHFGVRVADLEAVAGVLLDRRL